MKNKIILVKWTDAWGEEGWKSQSNMLDFLKNKSVRLINSVGFLLLETEEAIFLTTSIDEENVDFTLMIPRGNIKSIKHL